MANLVIKSTLDFKPVEMETKMNDWEFTKVSLLKHDDVIYYYFIYDANRVIFLCSD